MHLALDFVFMLLEEQQKKVEIKSICLKIKRGQDI